MDEEIDSAKEYKRLVETAVLHKADKAALPRSPELQRVVEWRSRYQSTKTRAQRYNSGSDTACIFKRQYQTQPHFYVCGHWEKYEI